jgi:ABC-2 type transport system ATP-binding protein
MNKVKYNISLKNVIKTINKKALLKNINFDIPTGAICAFIGASGSGKTTTIKVMMNL